MTKTAKHEIDLTNGPIFKKLIVFALPLIFTNLLHLIFNATDIIVLGVLVDEFAVGAVSATTSLVSLIINLFIGLSVGASVVLSKCVGSGDKEKASRVVGTATVLSIIIGVFLLFVGYFGSYTFLSMMGCAKSLIDDATKYLQIYFLGVPVIIFYNFAAGLLRAVGDTFRPMLFLLIAGIANVALNVFFIKVFNLTVEGVAIGTIASQGISAALALIALIKNDGFCKLRIKRLKIYKAELLDVLKVGLPSGLQSTMFSISNVLIQTTINGYGELAITANGIAQQFDAFVYTVGQATSLACMSFVAQNYGAIKPNRIKNGIVKSCILSFIFQLSFGLIVILLSSVLCGIMTDDVNIINLAKIRLNIMCSLYFICGIMEVLTNSLRALGKSTSAMIVSIFFVCVFRIIWLNSIYLLAPSLSMIFYSYPVSQLLCIIVNVLILVPTIKNVGKQKN
ncbi:MAG: MATE family efflux transporter [Clostridia bacterium]|nr:MATE family efflux transporter [Clostridia bacterium]